MLGVSVASRSPGGVADGVMVSIEEVNGAPALLGWVGPVLVGVLVPNIADGRITFDEFLAGSSR
ncbi:hypothetical protein EV193_104420 [Herbihabitans rhizosphaerae]|uniref:Uncharacterized protein n=1 Tax=Herbihabitans rhizosphaerae TaxID=1872711 RepID=A0A4Q7KRP8_9PSEU|nr:hypothetical protein [Herbihabitans rhizosphaerae]RZS39204.1 hypothetical protein EV193_104420 [Herbihabitans rhizosphaerae]